MIIRKISETAKAHAATFSSVLALRRTTLWHLLKDTRRTAGVPALTWGRDQLRTLLVVSCDGLPRGTIGSRLTVRSARGLT
jgi:hypothetical protein